MSWLAPPQPDAALPVHRQIHHAIREAVGKGVLAPGERLPGVRTLAERYRVNRLTVLKAVRGLAKAGFLVTVPGKGVYVASLPPIAGSEGSSSHVPSSFFEGEAEGPALAPTEVERLTDGIMETLKDGLAPGVLSFAAGFPPPEAIPVERVRRTANRLLGGPEGAQLLGYAPTQGSERLHEALCELLEERGLTLEANDNVLITVGAQQGIALCLEALLEPGKTLAVESPGYMGVIAACRLRGIAMQSVPVDAGGLNLSRLEQVLRSGDVGAVYTVPSYQNPTGVSQGLRRRRRLLELARQYDVTVLEDDVYADLRFGGRRPPPLKALADGARVVYLSSFSKSLAPSLRVGYLVADEDTIKVLRRVKETVDISTSAIMQAVTAELILGGTYRRHLMGARRLYRERRDAMIEALERHLPEEVSFTRPRGGLHLWVMPEGALDSNQLLERARERGVVFAPGSLFFCDGRRSAAFRLNYSILPPDAIAVGVERLAGCLREAVRDRA